MVKKLDLYKLGVVVEVNGQKSLATLQQVEKQSNSVQTSFKGLRGEIGSLKASLTGGGGSGEGGGLFGAISSGLQLLPGLSIVAASVGKITDVMKSGVKIGFDYNRVMEEAQIGFEVMMKSRTKATQHLKDLDGLTLKSPFDLEVLIKGSELAQAFRFKTAEIQRLLLTTGDASRGVQEKFEGIITALGQIKTKGKLSFEEMNQLVERGVPAWDYLADEIAKVDKNIARLTGDKRTGAVQKMAERGLISSSGAIEALLRGMEADFGGIGERVSNETASGLESQMRDGSRRVVGAATKGLFEGYKDTLRAGIATVGSDTVTSLADSLGANSEQLIGAGADMGRSLIKGIKGSLRMNSPSIVLQEMGTQAASSFVDRFIEEYETMFGRIGASTKKNLATLVSQIATDEDWLKLPREVAIKQVAYLLSTVKTETGNFKSRGEIGQGRGHAYGSTGFHGRGYVQLTHHDNYLRAGRKLGLDLVNNPELAMKPEVAYQIAKRGMREGWFRGDKKGQRFNLNRFLNTEMTDFYHARAIINGYNRKQGQLDKGRETAANAERFESVLSRAGFGSSGDVMPVSVVNLSELKGLGARDLSEHGGFVPRDAASIAAGLDVVAKLKNANADLPLTTNGDLGGFENVVIKPLKMLPPAMREMGSAAKASLAPIKGLIQSESRLAQMRGMLGGVAGMMPQQQVGKKRGFFSKLLGVAAPFLGFIPGVGPLLSTLAGIGSSALAGDWGGALMATAGGFASGGAFRRSGGGGVSSGGTTNVGGVNMPNPGTAVGAITTTGNTINTNLSNRYPGRARGGPVSRGRAYLVGEHRPEVVQFGNDGYVHPSIEAFSRAANSGGGLAGGGKGGFWNSWRENFDRLAGAIEKFETMTPGEVLTKGAKTHPGAIGDGLKRAGSRDPKVAEWMRRQTS
ncbi:MAG: tape measure protein [Acidobacteria bacterium]|nr:tape measure protein [Acidobacteriota bacterium]